MTISLQDCHYYEQSGIVPVFVMQSPNPFCDVLLTSELPQRDEKSTLRKLEENVREFDLEMIHSSERIILAFMLFGVYIIFSTVTYFYAGTAFLNDIISSEEASDQFWTVCKLPVLNPWDPELMQAIAQSKNKWKKKCWERKSLTKLENGKVFVEPPYTGEYCRARCHRHLNDVENVIGGWQELGENMNCEFVETACWRNNTMVYGRMDSQIIPGKIKPLKKAQTKDSGPKHKYDVYILLLDSVAYSQSRRVLRKTMHYFENDMKAVTFPHINKVGDNSRPNGIALWFGKSVEALDKTLFGGGVTPADWDFPHYCDTYLDDEMSIFKEFGQNGYTTLLGEDWADGVLNWPHCKGFLKKPVNHYMRPFQLATERLGSYVTRNNSRDGSTCREPHHTLLKYLQQFMDAYPDELRKMAWLWMSHLGHDSPVKVEHADPDFLNFLKHNKKKLDNSFVVIMGDHGLRFGEVTKTRVGAIDVNNPLFSISIPSTLRRSSKILENLKENARHLQTHYDIRATLLELARHKAPEDFNIEEEFYDPNEKGTSLLRKPNATLTRSCHNLPIPFEYCMCEYSVIDIDRNTELAKTLGEFLALSINKRLEEKKFDKKCMKMQFKAAQKLTRYREKMNGSYIYTLSVVMDQPSFANFKAKIRDSGNGSMEIVGTINREDSYKRTANCIDVNSYRPLCYCRKHQ
ncbi:unnamed protein product [Caenorhabditis auriculariae]|uniref:Uncharacterized protein n=1 Tax=Caenorhabditis auriculariae TaxID=2777116 RepID=A0A8S1GWB9_9PELO|nr:unnamed protein product [Caenorhabditis auriculariae]